MSADNLDIFDDLGTEKDIEQQANQSEENGEANEEVLSEQDIFNSQDLNDLDELVRDQVDELVTDEDDFKETKGVKKRKTSSGEVQQQDNGQRFSKKEEKIQMQMQMIKIQKEIIKKEVEDIKSFMKEQHKRDVKAVQKKKPALNKITHIDDIIVKLSKEGVQKEFIASQGLDYLTNWLDTIPEGPEPSVSLRKKLLSFIYELPVQKQHFQGIRLGKVIFKISQNSTVKELRHLANRIVEKWSKVLNNRNKPEDADEQDVSVL